MPDISIEVIKKLREETGAGMMDVKKALNQAGGDPEKAKEELRKQGLAARAKKATRVASEGLIDSYIHAGGKVGVLVEVNCETDFVARTDDFAELVHEIAMHIAAAAPQYIIAEDIPEEVVEKEKEIVREKAITEEKPKEVIEKIVEGRIAKFYEEVTLMNQRYIKNQDQTIAEVVGEYVNKLGENIKVTRFERFVLGEE